MDYKAKYNEFLERIESKLVEYINKSEPEYIYEPFKYIMQAGGKRIRPVLCLIATSVFGKDSNEATKTALAIEILHNFTLVHDDIMDGSPFRRNRETIHKKWDDATAILTGDLMIAYAYSLLPQNLPRTIKIYDAFNKAFLEVNEGQGYDMDFNERKDLIFDDYLKMIQMKTSSLLICPAVMGGQIGEATDEEIEALREYAKNMGIAFQIQDDFLDMTADETVLGKKTGLDIIEGKKTCLIIQAKDKDLTEPDRELMDKFYAENGLDAEYIPKMDELFKKYGVYDEINAMADGYFKRAIEATKKLPQNEYTELLVWLCKSLNKREK